MKTLVLLASLSLFPPPAYYECQDKYIGVCVPQQIYCLNNTEDPASYSSAKAFITVYRLECDSPECQAIRNEWLSMLDTDLSEFKNHFCECYIDSCCMKDEERGIYLTNCFNNWEDTYDTIFNSYISGFMAAIDSCCDSSS